MTQNKLLAWPDLKTKLPLLAAALPFVGHFQTRNKGTVCGSIAHADPSSEIPLSLATLEGEVVLRGKRGERVLKAKDFQLDMMTTAREGDELIVAVRFPVHGRAASAFREVARRHGDFAMVAVAALIEDKGTRPARHRRHGGQRRWCGASRTAASRTPSKSSPPELEGYEDLHASARIAARHPAQSRAARHRGGATMRRVNKDQKVRISLTLNGRKMSAETEPRMLLSDFLRHSLGATGTHVGCEHGVCGCCTVQIDGAAVRSCLTLAMQAEGRDVKTVESLAGADGKLNKLQQAFQNHHALQCGFCTPGILMSFTDFLARNPKPTEEELREVLSGHICRCTGYAGIMAALKEAAGLNTNRRRTMNEQTKKDAAEQAKPVYRELVTINGKNVVLAHNEPPVVNAGVLEMAEIFRMFNIFDEKFSPSNIDKADGTPLRLYTSDTVQGRRLASAASTTWASGIATSTPTRSSSASRAR